MLSTWILADSGSVRYLIDEAIYKTFPYYFLIRDLGECRVIGNNGEPHNLKLFTVYLFTFGKTLLWHKFRIVPNPPLDVVIGADIISNY